MSKKDQWLAQLRDEIPEVSPEEVAELLNGGNDDVVVVDVREGDEYRQGHLPTAMHLPRGFLELQAETKLASAAEKKVVAYCAGGGPAPVSRSAESRLALAAARSGGGGKPRRRGRRPRVGPGSAPPTSARRRDSPPRGRRCQGVVGYSPSFSCCVVFCCEELAEYP